MEESDKLKEHSKLEENKKLITDLKNITSSKMSVPASDLEDETPSDINGSVNILRPT